MKREIIDSDHKFRENVISIRELEYLPEDTKEQKRIKKTIKRIRRAITAYFDWKFYSDGDKFFTQADETKFESISDEECRKLYELIRNLSLLKCGESTGFVLAFLEHNYPDDFELFTLINSSLRHDEYFGRLKHFPDNTGKHKVAIIYHKKLNKFFGLSPANLTNLYRFFDKKNKYNDGNFINSAPQFRGNEFNRLTDIFITDDIEEMIKCITELEGGLWEKSQLTRFEVELSDIKPEPNYFIMNEVSEVPLEM